MYHNHMVHCVRLNFWIKFFGEERSCFNMAIQISPVNMEDRKKIGVQPGDTVRVWQKIQEKGKTRLQAFEGLVLARKHGNEPGATFTVRRTTGNVNIEKIFPLYSPMIDKIEIIKRSKVRRAKLYYIREKAAREIKRQMRHMKMMDLSTASDMAERERKEKAEQEAREKEVESQKETDENSQKSEEIKDLKDENKTEQSKEEKIELSEDKNKSEETSKKE